MKKVLAIVLCVCIALTLSLVVMAESSPKTSVVVRKGTISKLDGTTVPADTYVEVAEDNTVTVKSDKTYGNFNKWSIYKVVQTANGTTTYEEAKEGVDYTIVSGSLKDGTLVIKPLTEIVVAGDYNNVTTNPANASSVSGSSHSSKTGDVEVMYIAFALLAAGAVLLGAKKQLSK